MQGCIVDALAQLAQGVTIENGRIKETNFHQYYLARMPITPVVDVYFMPTTYRRLAWVSQPIHPPRRRSCNAIFAATKKRIRTLADHPRGIHDH